MDKIDIKSYDEAELLELITNLGQPKFRAAQLFKWLQQGIEDFDEMTNIPKNLLDVLKENGEYVLKIGDPNSYAEKYKNYRYIVKYTYFCFKFIHIT